MSRRFRDCSKQSLLLGIVLCLALSMTASGQPPNFILIYVDDLGWEDVGFNGAEFYETPNIDRIAEEGIIFSDAYAAAPSCSPSRASLLSGMYTPRHHGYLTVGKSTGNLHRMKLLTPIFEDVWTKSEATRPMPADLFNVFKTKRTLSSRVVSIAEMLGGRGYVSARLGKWKIGGGKQGFDVSVTSGNRKDGTSAFQIGDKAVEFIENNKQRSFFLYISHFDVHKPYNSRKYLVKKYKMKQAEWTGNGDYNPRYAASIEAVDLSVGQILDALEKSKISEKTLVILTSDNGSEDVTPNKPFRGFKTMLYEGGIRVPTCMRWPGVISPESESSVPITQVDFLPTIAHLAGVPLPVGQPVDGENIEPLLKGQNALEERAIFWHLPLYKDDLVKPAGAIRKGDWKLIEFFEDGGRLELYNLRSDPSESRNMVKAEPVKAKRLHQELIAWQKDTNAPVPRRPNPYFRDDSLTRPDSGTSERLKNRLSQVKEEVRIVQARLRLLQDNWDRLSRFIGQLKEAEKQDKALQSSEDDIRELASSIVTK